MADAADRNHSLPGIHALHLAEVLERWEISAASLFEGSGVDPARLHRNDARLPLDQVERLVERAIELSGEPAIGLYLGQRMQSSAHGHLGFAALTSSNVRQALMLAVRFAPTRTEALALRLHEGAEQTALVIEERASFGRARETVLLALLVGIWQIGVALTGRPLEGSVDVAMPAPRYEPRIRAVSDAIRFDQPVTQFVFPTSTLDLPLTMADPVAQRWVVAECERALEAASTEAQLGARVRALLVREAAGEEPSFRSLEQVASELALSPRTLKRRLAEGGLAFSALLDAERRERAIVLLRSSRLGIDEIGARVGYADPANFVRAFRRWVGATPAAYRRSLGARRSDR
jgi:AraC-like DNA-binding protein